MHCGLNYDEKSPCVSLIDFGGSFFLVFGFFFFSSFPLMRILVIFGWGVFILLNIFT